MTGDAGRASERVAGQMAPAVAVIGCGAIAENFHLPALVNHEDVRRNSVVVDVELDRAERLSAKFGISRTECDYTEVLGDVDGAIVAVPPRLHLSVTRSCLESGVVVLCEKPLAENRRDAEIITEESETAGVPVAVNNTRRLYPSVSRIRQLIRSGSLGELSSIEIEMGEEFDWPAASNAYFGQESGGRGVMQDIGAHMVDLVCWWLDGKPDLEKFLDDSFGGSEAVADASFSFGECRIHIRLSWLSKLSNAITVTGTEGSVTTDVYDWNRISRRSTDGRERIETIRPAMTEQDLADAMIRNFLSVCSGQEDPIVAAAEVVPSIALIEECYDRRERFELPWLDIREDFCRPGTTAAARGKLGS